MSKFVLDDKSTTNTIQHFSTSCIKAKRNANQLSRIKVLARLALGETYTI